MLPRLSIGHAQGTCVVYSMLVESGSVFLENRGTRHYLISQVELKTMFCRELYRQTMVFQIIFFKNHFLLLKKQKGKRKVQGVPQSQTAALPRPQEEEETDKSKQAQIEQTYEKH